MAIYTTPDSYTKLLIHSDGTDGSSTMVDSSAGGHSVTSAGVTHADNGAGLKKFGSTALYFVDNGDYLTIPGNADWNFGTGDFTIDFWLYFISGVAQGNYQAIVTSEDSGGAGVRNWWISMGAAGPAAPALTFYDYDNSVGSTAYDYTSYINQWAHIACVRVSGICNVYVNGVTVSSSTMAGSIGNSTDPTYINRVPSATGRYIKGYIDEFRISKGIARWTSNFTPPSKPYDIINTDTQTADSKEDTAFEVTGGGNAQFGGSIVTRSDPGEAGTDSLFSINSFDGSEIMDVKANGKVALSAGGISSISGTLVVADDTWTDMYDFGTNDGLYIVFAYIDDWAGQSWSAYRICRVTGYSTIGGAGANASYFQLRDDGTKVQVWHSTDQTTVTFKILRIH